MVPEHIDNWQMLVIAVGLYANAVLIVSNLYLMLRLRKGPPRPKHAYPRARAGHFHPYPLSPTATALVRQLLREMEIHFQIQHHEFWDQIRDPSVPDILYRPWSDGQEGTNFSNLLTPEVSIQWHIIPGRFCFADRELNIEEWGKWYESNIHRITTARDEALHTR